MDSPADERSSLRLRCVTAHVLMQQHQFEGRVNQSMPLHQRHVTVFLLCSTATSLPLPPVIWRAWKDSHSPLLSALFLPAAPLTVCDPEVWHFPSSPQVSVTQPGALARCPPPYLSQEGTKEGCCARISSSALPDCVTPADSCTPAEPRGVQEAGGFTADLPFHLDCLYKEIRLRSSPPLCPWYHGSSWNHHDFQHN